MQIIYLAFGRSKLGFSSKKYVDHFNLTQSELMLILSCHDISWFNILYVKFVVGKFRAVEVLLTTFLKLWKIHFYYCLRHNIKRTLGPKTIKSFDSFTIENHIKTKEMVASKFLASSWGSGWHFRHVCSSTASGKLARGRIAESPILSAGGGESLSNTIVCWWVSVASWGWVGVCTQHNNTVRV